MQFESSTADQVIARLHACRDHFARGTTRSYKARQSALKALRSAIKKHEEALLTAMYTDMRKPRFEAYLGDVGLV